MTNLLCTVLGHRMFFETSNVAGPSSCSRCDYTEEGIVWPREINTLEVHMESEDKQLTDEELQAKAVAADYEALNSEDNAAVMFPMKDIIFGLLIAGAVILVITTGILIFA